MGSFHCTTSFYVYFYLEPSEFKKQICIERYQAKAPQGMYHNQLYMAVSAGGHLVCLPVRKETLITYLNIRGLLVYLKIV